MAPPFGAGGLGGGLLVGLRLVAVRVRFRLRADSALSPPRLGTAAAAPPARAVSNKLAVIVATRARLAEELDGCGALAFEGPTAGSGGNAHVDAACPDLLAEGYPCHLK